MASPPPPPPSIVPQKRPSLSSNASVASNPAKRRNTLHPLRQTSFPAVDAAPYAAGTSSVYSDAGSVTGSMVSGISGGGGGGPAATKKRGRPKKNAPTQAGSAVAGSDSGVRPRGEGTGDSVLGRPGSRSGKSAGGSAVDGGDGEEDDDYEVGEGEGEGDLEEQMQREADEKGLIWELIQNTMNPNGQRGELFKSVKLSERSLKKIVNQTCSQSVAQRPIKALGFAVKWFVGEIVELACDVQDEMAERWDEAVEKKLWLEELAEARKKAQVEAEKEREKENQEPGNRDKDIDGGTRANGEADPHPQSRKPDGDTNSTATTTTTTTTNTQTANTTSSPSNQNPSPIIINNPNPKPKKPHPPKPGFTLSGHENPHRGGLLPEHLREALRRYRAGEGNGVGFGGLSVGMLGSKGGKGWAVEGVGSGMGGGGGRLFR
ncbi:MAG: hypothetical protein Q9227_004728 [Pyrenula ochraceoflavens]